MARMPDWIRLKGLRAFGAPVFVHWSVLAALGVLILFTLSNPAYAALFASAYLAVIVVHELGHALVARRLGYEVDSIGITALHGWCRCAAPDYEWHAVLIAWGGVAAQLVVAVPVLLLTLALGSRDWGLLTPIIIFLGYLNLVLVAVNLIPGDGSDGTIAWRIIPLWRQQRR